MTLDYLTLSIPDGEYIIDPLLFLFTGCEQKLTRAVYPYHTAFDITCKKFLVGKIRINGNVKNSGFTTIDLFGKWFEVVYKPQDKLNKFFSLLSQNLQCETIKIARFDVKFDTEDYPTSYNPNELPLFRFYAGKGQPTYYYGNDDDLTRVYDKTQEYLDSDGISIDQQITRFEFQLRDKYIPLTQLPRFIEISENLCFQLLFERFGIYNDFQPQKLLSYKVSKTKSIDDFRNYCTMAQSIIDLYGETAFLNFVYQNAKKDRKKYHDQYIRDSYVSKLDYDREPQNYNDFLSEMEEINKYLEKEHLICK